MRIPPAEPVRDSPLGLLRRVELASVEDGEGFGEKNTGFFDLRLVITEVTGSKCLVGFVEERVGERQQFASVGRQPGYIDPVVLDRFDGDIIARFGRYAEDVTDITFKTGEQPSNAFRDRARQHRVVAVRDDDKAELTDRANRSGLLRNSHVVRPNPDQPVADGDQLEVTETHLGATSILVIECDAVRDLRLRLSVACHTERPVR